MHQQHRASLQDSCPLSSGIEPDQTSNDGQNWVKPSVRQIRFAPSPRGSRQNRFEAFNGHDDPLSVAVDMQVNSFATSALAESALSGSSGSLTETGSACPRSIKKGGPPAPLF